MEEVTSLILQWVGGMNADWTFNGTGSLEGFLDTKFCAANFSHSIALHTHRS